MKESNCLICSDKKYIIKGNWLKLCISCNEINTEEEPHLLFKHVVEEIANHYNVSTSEIVKLLSKGKLPDLYRIACGYFQRSKHQREFNDLFKSIKKPLYLNSLINEKIKNG